MNPTYDMCCAKGRSHRDAVELLIHDIRRQYRLSMSTMNICLTKGCDEAVVGTGHCRLCLTDELGRVTGDPKGAQDFAEHTRAAHVQAMRLLEGADNAAHQSRAAKRSVE